MMATNEQATLKRTLGPLMLWGLGVGYVISGMYFGWNLGLPLGGTLGMAIATFFIIILYVTFTFSYTELACAIPKAGGAFDYAYRALGPRWGFMAGMAQNVEFIFAPPAIAFAIGAYFHTSFPDIPVKVVAISAYLIFTLLNISGVRAAAIFELLVTILAVAELLLFAGITLPHVELSNVVSTSLPNGISGIFAALPFAIWFFLGIEGVANVAEETVNPQRNVVLGFGSAIATLVVLCLLTFVSAVGVSGWEGIVYPEPGAMASDSPLPLALKKVLGERHVFYHLLITVGLFGLIASFHGLLLAAGRSMYEFAKVGYAPAMLGKVNAKTKTPAIALTFNMLLGIIAILTGKTAEIITIAVFGALCLYAISMYSLMVLRRREPQLERPFQVPLYPFFPIIALTISIVSLLAMVYYNPLLSMIYIAILVFSYGYYRLTKGNKV
ncbi:MAG: ethanolamine permease [Chitinophagales bacterium]|nr:ethanolamine permease [Chitinophagales bacterium]